jgi:ATP-dependent Clp protease adapter protein ClpS
MSKTQGYLKFAEIRGAPVSVHWTLPAAGLIAALIDRVASTQWLYYYVAYAVLIACHEAGHVLAVLGLRLKVYAVQISVFGGLCRFELPRPVRQNALIYAAGFLAQLALLLPALAYVTFRNGFPTDAPGQAICITFTFVNITILILNLIPKQGGLDTDGVLLWRLYRHVYWGRPHPHPLLAAAPLDQAPFFPPDTRLMQKPEFQKPGFVHGIEVLNDRTTPMDFVVKMFTEHLRLTEREAVALMVQIHNTGGALIALPSVEDGRRLADQISAEAQAAGHLFVCRFAGG